MPSSSQVIPNGLDNLLGQLATLTVDQADRVFRDLHVSHPALASQLAAKCVPHLASRVRILTTVDRPAGPLISDNAGFLSTVEPLQAGSGDTQIDHARTDFLGGRYKVIEELGRGAFGVVCLGEDTRTGQKVALKTMVKHGGRALEFFKGEFRYLQGIAHPNLVQLLELASDDHGWLIVMEFIEGTDFLAYVRPEGSAKVDINRLRHATGQLIEGIRALHLQRRLHRDLKPQNIRVTPEGRVVLVDFGLATEAGNNGEMRYPDYSTPGTIPFMAPEQFGEPPVSSTATDLYSIGVILYMALTGKLPFAGNLSQIVFDKLTKDPEPFKNNFPDAPEDLEKLCLDLMARRPEDRPNADDVLKRLGLAPAGHQRMRLAEENTLLLGRDTQIAELKAAFAGIRQGNIAVVKLMGPSGIGKSALVKAFLAGLESASFTAISCRCYEHETVPYKALDPVVDEITRHLNSLPEDALETLSPFQAGPLIKVFPALERVPLIALAAKNAILTPDVHELRKLAFVGLRQLLQNLARLKPLVIHIDDLQWGDIDSAYLLADLCLPPNPPAILWILAHRSEDAQNPCLVNLRDSLRRINVVVQESEVLPLSDFETERLVVGLLGDQAANHSKQIIRESGGNPYFVAELAQAVLSGNKEISDNGLTLDGLIRSRVSKLQPAARRLLEIVAVSGRPLGDIDAYQAADRNSDPRTAAAQLESARLIRGIGEAGDIKLETYHDRVREAVIAGLETELATSLHAKLGSVLEASGRTDDEQLALHFEMGKQVEKSSIYYERAGDKAASSLAFEQAADFFRKSTQLGQNNRSRTEQLNRKLADSLANGGRGAEAGPVYLKIAESCEGLEDLEFQRLAMEQFLASGHTDRGFEIMNNLFSRLDFKLPKTNNQALFKMFWEVIALRLRGYQFKKKPVEEISPEELWKIDVLRSCGHQISMINVTTASCIVFRSARWALDCGETERIAQCLSTAGKIVACEGGGARKRADALLSIVKGLTNKSQDDFGKIYVTANEVVNYWAIGEWRKAIEISNHAEDMIYRGTISFASYRNIMEHFALDIQMMLGDWKAYAERSKKYLEFARRKGDLFGKSMMMAHSYLPALMAGNPGLAERLTNESWETWPQKGNVAGVYWGLFGRVEASLYEGHGIKAWQRLMSEKDELNRQTHYKLLQSLQILMVHLQGRAAISAAMSIEGGNGLFSRKSKFLRKALGFAKKIQKAKMPWSNPLANLLSAGVANVRGNPTEAISLLSEAEAGFATADMKMHAMASRRQRGRLIGGSEGETLVVQADAFMTNEGIREPVRIAGMLAPGFPD